MVNIDWTARLQQDFPGATIAAVGSIPSSGDARTKEWNATVIGKIRGIDAITVHRIESLHPPSPATLVTSE
jgi:hypothetical protein